MKVQNRSFARNVASMAFVFAVIVTISALVLTLPGTDVLEGNEYSYQDGYEYQEIASGIIERAERGEELRKMEYFPELSREREDKFAKVWQPVPEPTEQ